ncbi:SNF7 family protein [Achlya hypogyna]|uniref:SNF7 family protein n=1 Tax=Achlya hypogyna TaxID=1202772 RepID=A0A1V9YGJ3_ACHHY|nr:SNF7 family protein [Achlya hypogyna]
MFGFGKPQKTPREQAREAKREIAHGQRDLEREKAALERQEKTLVLDIKRAAKDGNAAGTKILAKQLVQVRQQKDKLSVMKANLGGIAMQASTMAAQHVVMATMEKTTKTMVAANKQMDMGRIQKTLMEFEKQSEMMNMKEEMLDDTLIDAFEDDDEEENLVVDQVLAEIGLDLHTQLGEAPTTVDPMLLQLPEAPKHTAASAPVRQ